MLEPDPQEKPRALGSRSRMFEMRRLAKSNLVTDGTKREIVRRFDRCRSHLARFAKYSSSHLLPGEALAQMATEA